MINENYVTPVGTSNTPYVPDVKVPTKEQITRLLAARGYPVHIGDLIARGTMSQVFEATARNNQPVIVKQTNGSASTDPTSVVLSAKSHFIDTALLRYLDGVVRVPHVLQAFDDVPVTVTQDLRSDGFLLLQDLLLNGDMPPSGTKFGVDVALILTSFARHHEFYAITSGRQEFYERGLQLRLAFPTEFPYYSTLEERFTTSNQQLVALDLHPKNVFVNEDSIPAWINFGRSTWADRDFSLPSFLAHIAIVALAGYIDREEAAHFIRQAIDGYRSMLPIDDDIFCLYFACEVLHRWSGRWIEGIDTTIQKLALVEFGLLVFEHQIMTIDELLDLLTN